MPYEVINNETSTWMFKLAMGCG